MPGNTGIPAAIRDLVIVVPFNDADAVARALAEHRGQIAAMILEPVMMNAGIIPPDDGYLAAIRDLVHADGALLIFDEVKTGFTTGPGGVTALSGVVPDMVCLAKALGGGISVAAIGGTREVMSAIADGRYEQVGTFNGNPLAMAATRATLSEVLTPDAYRHLDELATAPAVGAGVTSSPSTASTGTSSSARRQGLRDVPARPGAGVPRLPRHRRPTRATCTGSCSTMAGFFCRHGGRWSNGCCPSSTTAPMSTGSPPTSPGSPRRWRTERPRDRPDGAAIGKPGRRDPAASSWSSPSTACPR